MLRGRRNHGSKCVEIDVCDLAGGVHTGIRSPGDDQAGLPAEDSRERALDRALLVDVVDDLVDRLAIVRQVAESHGGDVVAEHAEGGGTRMVLRLGARQTVAAPS